MEGIPETFLLYQSGVKSKPGLPTFPVLERKSGYNLKKRPRKGGSSW